MADDPLKFEDGMNDAAIPPQLPDECRGWATGVLQESVQATAQQRKSRILAVLDNSDLVPDADTIEAIRVVSCRPSRGEWCRRHHHTSLVQDVDSYLEAFFELAPEKRRVLHAELLGCCGNSPVLRRHLEKIARGLDVVITSPNDDDPRIAEWRRLMCLLFTARPDTRARMRRAALNEMAAEPEAWLHAAIQFEGAYPQLANLNRNDVNETCALLNDACKVRDVGSRVSRLRRRSRLSVMLSPVFGLLVPLMFVALSRTSCSQPRRDPPPSTTWPQPQSVDDIAPFKSELDKQVAVRTVRIRLIPENLWTAAERHFVKEMLQSKPHLDKINNLEEVRELEDYVREQFQRHNREPVPSPLGNELSSHEALRGQ